MSNPLGKALGEASNLSTTRFESVREDPYITIKDCIICSEDLSKKSSVRQE